MKKVNFKSTIQFVFCHSERSEESLTYSFGGSDTSPGTVLYLASRSLRMTSSIIFKLVSVLLLLFLLRFPNPVLAHVLETNGSVGAVMHVTPDDDPVAGEQADFYFEFKDRENKFLAENCDCIVSIYQSGNEIFSQPLFQNSTDPSLSNASFSFVFPERDIYNIKITGRPLAPGAFSPFILTYVLRVERVTGEKQSNTDTISQPNILYFVIPVLLTAGVYVYFSKKHMRHMRERKG